MDHGHPLQVPCELRAQTEVDGSGFLPLPLLRKREIQQNLCRRSLGRHSPKGRHFIPPLPKSPSNRLRRHRLRALGLDLDSDSSHAQSLSLLENDRAALEKDLEIEGGHGLVLGGSVEL